MTGFAGEAQQLGKSARTRARLMDAAVAIFARDGFYVHFKDKDDIAAAVAFRIATDVTRKLDEAMAGMDDAVERTSTATRRFVEFLAARPGRCSARCGSSPSFAATSPSACAPICCAAAARACSPSRSTISRWRCSPR
jgi:AcrR family transcriptional regulator